MWKTLAQPYSDYEISPAGQVRNRVTKRISKPSVRGKHMVVNLKSSKFNYVNLARLVAYSYLPTPTYTDSWVEHIDGDITNCAALNLRWSNRAVASTIKEAPTKEELDELLGKGLTPKQISEMFYISQTLVRMLVKRYGLELPSYKIHRNLDKPFYSEKPECELWKNLTEDYEISNYGRVRKTLTKENLYVNSSGNFYLMVDGCSKMKYLHMEVARAWIPNPHGFKYVIALDGNKLNASVENLLWIPVRLRKNHKQYT